LEEGPKIHSLFENKGRFLTCDSSTFNNGRPGGTGKKVTNAGAKHSIAAVKWHNKKHPEGGESHKTVNVDVTCGKPGGGLEGRDSKRARVCNKEKNRDHKA